MKIFLTKSFALIVLFALLQIPLSWTQQTITERSGYRQSAIDYVASSYAKNQKIIGPIIKIPYTRTYWHEYKDEEKKTTVREQRTEEGSLTYLPENYTVHVKANVEERVKGIFPVPVFSNALTIEGNFNLPDANLLINSLKSKEEDIIKFYTPLLNLGISDQRGIKEVKPLKINTQSVNFYPGNTLDLENGKGLYAVLNPATIESDNKFSIDITLAGTNNFSIIPIGEKNNIFMGSNWPHPQFNGNQLPDKRQIDNNGFTANWQTTDLATNINVSWDRCKTRSDCSEFLNQEVGVSFFEPIDVYQQSTRTVKYGMLFLAITFAAFLLYEVLCKLNIHPLQYGFVGLALAIFFLLVLSFSEHVGFAKAYFIASGSCITLLSIYVHAILKHWLRTSIFLGILIGLYSAVYIILQLEDAALVAGSVLLFSLLALAMMVTRKIDWYNWQNQLAKKATEINS